MHYKTLIKKARKLRKNLPRAEQWFRRNWPHSFSDELSNMVFGYYIPDIHSPRYAYVIEIDEDYHNTPLQQEKDKRRECYFTERGYTVFRIPAYNLSSLQSVSKQVVALRALGHAHAKEKKKLAEKALKPARRSYWKPVPPTPLPVKKPAVFIPRTILRKASA